MHLQCLDARRDVVMFARHLSIMSWCPDPGNAENDNGRIMLIEGATNTDISSSPHNTLIGAVLDHKQRTN